MPSEHHDHPGWMGMWTGDALPVVATDRYYPEMPPGLPGETSAQYADRLTGADQTGRSPYDHRRFRQCSIGFHDECSDPTGEQCECPCHEVAPLRMAAGVHTNEEWEAQAWRLDASLTTALQEKDQWHDAAVQAEGDIRDLHRAVAKLTNQLDEQSPVVRAAIKLTERWDTPDHGDVIPWINDVARAVRKLKES